MRFGRIPGRQKVPVSTLILGTLLIGYAALLNCYLVPVTGGTDQNGYHLQGRLLNEEGTFYRKAADPLEFIGHMWVVNERGEFYPKYPPFYPAMTAAINLLLGPGGGFYATLWAAVLAAAGMYVLARFFVGRYFALMGAGALMVSPVVSMLGIVRNSHTPSLAFFLWGLAAFFGAVRAKSLWGRLAGAFAGGFLIGWTVGIRYTDLLLILIPAAYLMLFPRGRRRVVLAVGLAAGAAIPYGMLAVFHWLAYGAPWRSGYSLTGEAGAFQLRFLWENLLIYVPEFFMLVVGPLGALAVLVPRLRWRRGLFWAAWLLPTFLLYLTYYWAPENDGTGAMRFLTPLVPAVVIAGLLALRRFCRQVPPRAAFLTVILVVAIQAGWGVPRLLKMCEAKAAGDLQNLVLIEALKQRVPPGASIVARTGLLNELDYELRWRLYPGYLLNVRELHGVIERSLGAQAAGLQRERARWLEEELGGLDAGRLQAKMREFFDARRNAGSEVYFVGRGAEVNQFRRIFHRHFELESLGMITGERPAWLLLPFKRAASRFQESDAPVKFTPYEVIRLGAKRSRVLPAAASVGELQQERAEVLYRLNPAQDPEIRRDTERLEAIRDETGALNRSIAEARRRAEAAKRARREKAAGRP